MCGRAVTGRNPVTALPPLAPGPTSPRVAVSGRRLQPTFDWSRRDSFLSVIASCQQGGRNHRACSAPALPRAGVPTARTARPTPVFASGSARWLRCRGAHDRHVLGTPATTMRLRTPGAAALISPCRSCVRGHNDNHVAWKCSQITVRLNGVMGRGGDRLGLWASGHPVLQGSPVPIPGWGQPASRWTCPLVTPVCHHRQPVCPCRSSQVGDHRRVHPQISVVEDRGVDGSQAQSTCRPQPSWMCPKTCSRRRVSSA